MTGVGWSVGAVARRLGIAPSTLRTWERRYNIEPSRHTEGGHRRYDETDVARLELMNRLILGGVPPEEAARSALAAGPEELAEPPAPSSVVPSGPAWGAGGNRLAVPDPTPATRKLAGAAMKMDPVAMQDLVWESISTVGVARTWQELLTPVLVGIGERQAASGRYVEVEHLLSSCVQSALSAVLAMADPPLTTRPVLLACAADEQHSLPVYALGAGLAEERVGVRVLGARMPYRALGDAIGRLGPAAVFVWSSMAATGDPLPLADLPATRPAHRLIVGGPGWREAGLPAGVRRVHAYQDALQALRSAVGAG
ncbi:MerR family transcriptional regulator [Actinomadura parmotrematis]|uniref:MerR family transcriptional regulator n=1 Tax=Actinomadura parmotrematis TaxID=2864039 RepID=UPI0027E238E2|nr:MerR family transcriptional regulator [Actinomadura parmotrematis]